MYAFFYLCLCSFHVHERWYDVNTKKFLCVNLLAGSRRVGRTCSYARVNKAVIDRRLRPRCCQLESYFEHASFHCRYIHSDASSPRLRVSLTGSAWRRRRAASSYVQIRRHIQNRKCGRYHYAPPEEDLATTIRNMHKNLVKIERVVPKIWSRTNTHTHTHTHTDTLITILRSALNGTHLNPALRVYVCREGDDRRSRRVRSAGRTHSRRG